MEEATRMRKHIFDFQAHECSKQQKIQKTIRLPEQLFGRIQREADWKGISINSEIIILLQKSLEDE